MHQHVAYDTAFVLDLFICKKNMFYSLLVNTKLMSSESHFLQLDIGIIGGGCSGLVTLKEFTAEGHRCRLFERSNSIGGLYTQAYREGIFVSSHLLTMFGDFVGKTDEILSKPRMLSFEEYVQYLNDYADQFQLNQFICCQSEVTRVWKDHSKNKWMISINNDE